MFGQKSSGEVRIRQASLVLMDPAEAPDEQGAPAKRKLSRKAQIRELARIKKKRQAEGADPDYDPTNHLEDEGEMRAPSSSCTRTWTSSEAPERCRAPKTPLYQAGTLGRIMSRCASSARVVAERRRQQEDRYYSSVRMQSLPC